MKRQAITADPQSFPEAFRPLISGAGLYDSSCSPQARVWFIDKDGGYYLKRAGHGELKNEAELTRFFHLKGLASEVLAYESLEQDWLLTTRVAGEDCIYHPYLKDPKRLCDTTAELLRQLHSMDTAGCPVCDRTAAYIKTVERNHARGMFDSKVFDEAWRFNGPEEAWEAFCAGRGLLKTDTLIHGDYCLPNIMLDNWRFSGFIDLGFGGVADRHIDLFWGMWSLGYNLKTNAWRERFLDVYGRKDINEELFRVIAAAEAFG